jgi:type I restriction enzyme S subunit
VRAAPLWASATLVSSSGGPLEFQVSLEDMVSETGRLVDGDLSYHRANGTRFQAGDVLFGKLRPYLAKYWLADREGTAGGDIHVYRPEPGVDPRYLAYVVGSRNFARFAEAASKGTKMPRAEWASLRKYPVIQFDLSTQRSIANYLDRETGEIDTMLSKMNLLTGALQARARIAQTRAVFGLAADASHDSLHSPSLLSGVPNHWGNTKFGYDFSESNERNGDSPPGPLLSISEYRGVELNTRIDGQQASLDVSNYRVVRPGQLAANMMWLNHGGLGVSPLTGYISPDYKAFWISKRFEPRYVHHLFRSSRYVGYFTAIATGVRPNAQRVTKTVLDATPVPLPPVDEQVRIADHLDEVTGEIDAVLEKVSNLKFLLIERRAALITDVVTGRKAVI